MGIILELEKLGWNEQLFCDLEDLGLVTPLSENKIANVNSALADSTSH